MKKTTAALAKCAYCFQEFILRLTYVALGFKECTDEDRNTSALSVIRVAALGDTLLSLRALSVLRFFRPSVKISLWLNESSQNRIVLSVKQYSKNSIQAGLGALIPPTLVNSILSVGNLGCLMSKKIVSERLKNTTERIIIILPQQGGGGVAFWVRRFIFLRLSGFRGVIYGWRNLKALRELELLCPPKTTLHASVYPLIAVCEYLGKSYEEVSRLFSDGIFIRSHIDQYYTQNKIGVIPQLWLSGTYRVALIMGSIQPHKRWPTPKFESLALELSKKKGIRVMLLGTDQFREDAEKIAQKNPLVISSLCGKTTLLELSVVLLKAHVCVGSDGGGVHLSAALGTPTVSLVPGIEPVGSVDPFGWERLSLRKAVECAPCRSFQCCPQGHHRCMNEIKLSDVMTNILIDLYKNDNKD